jgi:sugar lactone lactonase YvrE
MVFFAEPVTGPIAFHAEGPVWSERWGGLRWVDMLAGDILTLGTDGRVERRHVAEVVAAVRPRSHGGAVLGIQNGFALEDPDGEIHVLPALWGSGARMNEGGCDPDGRFYCGSLAADGRTGGGALYRLNADLSVDTVLRGVTVSNGIDWSPDGSSVYYNDTATGAVTVFDYDPGRGLVDPRVLVSDLGRPDGLTVDSEGGVWVALANGGEVRRFTPDGTLDRVVRLPVTRVTACAFGGPALTDLYITTSRQRIDTRREPMAGALFALALDVAGQPAREFAA